MGDCTCYPGEKNGVEYNRFIAENFGECLYSAREVSSFMVGMSSLLFWICCQTPQFLANYGRKSGKALSKWFLIEWFLGDALNLLGSILTKQLVTQRATSILFVCVDITMILQISYYSWIYNGPRPSAEGRQFRSGSNGSRFSEIDIERMEADDSDLLEGARLSGRNLGVIHESEGTSDNPDEVNSGGRGFTSLAAAGVTFSFVAWSVGSGMHPEEPESRESKTNSFTYVESIELIQSTTSLYESLPSCEPEVHISDTVKMAGITLGWISAIVYLNSRFPQLLKNYKRQSVEGLSWVMFFCAVMGNLTYGLGVLLKDSSASALLKALPWLVGSLGTLFFDFFILLQFQVCKFKPLAFGYLYLLLLISTLRSDKSRTWTVEDRLSSGYIAVSQDGAIQPRDREDSLEGLFGMRSWTASPLFKPRFRVETPRHNFSHGVLPSETLIHSSTENGAFSSIAQHILEEENLRETGRINRADSF